MGKIRVGWHELADIVSILHFVHISNLEAIEAVLQGGHQSSDVTVVLPRAGPMPSPLPGSDYCFGGSPDLLHGGGYYQDGLSLLLRDG
eukprot:13863360-Ditylum_brightwellii.AAC.1